MPLARSNAIVPLTAGSDLTGKAGRFVVRNGETVTLATNPAVRPFGVLLTDGSAGKQVSVAVASGGLAGTVRVKLGATVSVSGLFLQLGADGCAIPEDPSDAMRCVCAVALETGAINELIEAVIFNPLSYVETPRTPCAVGDITGSTTLDLANGALQKASLTGNVTLTAPANGTEGAKLELWLTPAGADRTLNFDGAIQLPSDSSLGLPKTLTHAKQYIVLLKHNGTAWMLASMVGGY